MSHETSIGPMLDPVAHPLSPLHVLSDVGLGGRAMIYDLAKRGELPIEVIRVGHSYRVRTIDVCRLIGQSVPEEWAQGQPLATAS
jgi:hypothetical protein